MAKLGAKPEVNTANTGKHLGRNPFHKKTPKEEESTSSTLSQSAQWLFVDLPSESLLFAIRTILKIKQALDR